MSGRAVAIFSDGFAPARLDFATATRADAALRAIRVAGPVGPAGPVGMVALELVASGPISGARAVVTRGGGDATYPDGATPADGAAIIGISTHAAADGAPVRVQLAGPLEDPAFAWSTGPVFADHMGVLTQIAPQNSWLRQVGVAVTPTKLVVQFGPAIETLET